MCISWLGNSQVLFTLLTFYIFNHFPGGIDCNGIGGPRKGQGGGVDGEKVALEGWTGVAKQREGGTRDTCVGLDESKAPRMGYRTVVCIQGLDWNKARQEVTRDALDVSMG